MAAQQPPSAAAAGVDDTPPLFGVLPSGQPLMTVPSSRPSPTSFLYLIPHATPSNPKPFAHLAVFLLPGIVLPDNTAAAIYLAQNAAALISGAETEPRFRFLGGVGPGKESTVFKLGGGGGGGGVQNGADGVVIGVNIEDAGSVAERIQQQQQQSAGGNGGAATAGVGGTQQPSTQVLAQRIIQNAYNFLSSFSGQAGEVEVVPLKAFQEWWRKFEGRVRSDPTFLERPQE